MDLYTHLALLSIFKTLHSFFPLFFFIQFFHKVFILFLFNFLYLSFYHFRKISFQSQKIFNFWLRVQENPYWCNLLIRYIMPQLPLMFTLFQQYFFPRHCWVLFFVPESTEAKLREFSLIGTFQFWVTSTIHLFKFDHIL